MNITRDTEARLINGILILAFLLVQLQTGSFENIKDTFTPLKDEYQHRSPIMGAIWWEHPYLLNNLN